MSKEALKLALDDLMAGYCMERTSFAKRVDEIFKQALAAPDLQAELEATNRQVEIRSDALAESRRQRPWVGLSDEEKQELVSDEIGRVRDYEDYADAIEAKLKEKNA